MTNNGTRDMQARSEANDWVEIGASGNTRVFLGAPIGEMPITPNSLRMDMPMSEYEAMVDRIKELEAELARVQGVNHDLQNESAELTRENATLETKNAYLCAQRDELERLNAILTDRVADWEDHRRHISMLRQMLDVALRGGVEQPTIGKR